MGTKLKLPFELSIQFKGKTTEEKSALLQQWKEEGVISQSIFNAWQEEMQNRKNKKTAGEKKDQVPLNNNLAAKIQRKKKDLKEANLLLVQNLTNQKTVSPQQISQIKGLLCLDDYYQLRDDYIALLITSFKFQQHPIKNMAAEFLRKMLEKEIVEWSILFVIVDLNYLSKKTYNILKEFHKTITASGLGEFLYSKLKTVYQRGYIYDWDKMKDIPINKEKMALLKELVELYKPDTFMTLEEEAIARGEVL